MAFVQIRYKNTNKHVKLLIGQLIIHSCVVRSQLTKVWTWSICVQVAAPASRLPDQTRATSVCGDYSARTSARTCPRSPCLCLSMNLSVCSRYSTHTDTRTHTHTHKHTHKHTHTRAMPVYMFKISIPLSLCELGITHTDLSTISMLVSSSEPLNMMQAPHRHAYLPI